MASKLSLYNGALLVLGERKLGSLAEERAPRRRLDTVWDGGAVKYCLQQGLWNFAIDTISLTYSPSVTIPDGFPYLYAFDKPENWVRTAIVSDDGQFINKRFDYVDQGAYWFANPDTIWVKHVSDHTSFGGDLSLWPENFTTYVEHYFAFKICKATSNSGTDRDALEARCKRLLSQARTTDAMDESAQFIPPGSWSQARRGGRTRGDGGSNSSL